MEKDSYIQEGEGNIVAGGRITDIGNAGELQTQIRA